MKVKTNDTNSSVEKVPFEKDVVAADSSEIERIGFRVWHCAKYN